LQSERHPFSLEGYCQTEQKGTFERNLDARADFAKGFEQCFLSYACEKDFPIARVSYTDFVAVFVQQETLKSREFADRLNGSFEYGEAVIAVPFSGHTRRGIAERTCGQWTLVEGNGSDGNDSTAKIWTKFLMASDKSTKKKLKTLDEFARNNSVKALSFHFPWASTAEQTELSFVLLSQGVEKGVADVDLRDLLASARVQSSIKTSFDQQRVVFPLTANSPLHFKGHDSKATFDNSPSWERPLLKACIPEGARILSVLASGRRKEHIVRLSSFDDKKNGKKSEGGEDSEIFDIHLDPKQTKS